VNFKDEPVHIVGRQFALIVFFYIVGTSILLVPSMLAGQAGQDAWISAAISILLGIALILMYNKLGSLFPNLPLTDLCQLAFGKWIGKGLSLLLLGSAYLLAALVLRNIGDFMTIQLLVDTPIQAILALFVVVTIMGARLGLEVLARAAEIFFPWFILLFSLLVILVIPEMKLDNLTPILEDGLKPTIRGTISALQLPFLELIYLMYLFPHVRKASRAKISFLKGCLLGGFVLFTVTFLSITVLGYELAARQFYPTYALAKKVNVGGFLQRIEVLVAVMWFLSIFFKLALLFYTVSYESAKLFGLRDYRPLTMPLGMILVILAIIISPNIVANINISSDGYIMFKLLMGLFIPALLLALALFRRHRKQQKASEPTTGAGG
jgi:spore germination protein KB